MINKLFFLSLSGFIFLFLISSCSKENDNIFDESHEKSAIVKDKIFAENYYTKIFTQYPGSPYFTNSSGQYNFTESGIPEEDYDLVSNGMGYFKHDQLTYPLTYGRTYWIEEHRFIIGLSGNELNAAGESVGVNFVGINIISQLPDEITLGYYEYSNSFQENTIPLAYIGLGLGTDYDPEKYFFFETGSMVITTSGNSYELFFHGYLENGKQVICYYVGQLEQQSIY